MDILPSTVIPDNRVGLPILLQQSVGLLFVANVRQQGGIRDRLWICGDAMPRNFWWIYVKSF